MCIYPDICIYTYIYIYTYINIYIYMIYIYIYTHTPLYATIHAPCFFLNDTKKGLQPRHSLRKTWMLWSPPMTRWPLCWHGILAICMRTWETSSRKNSQKNHQTPGNLWNFERLFLWLIGREFLKVQNLEKFQEMKWCSVVFWEIIFGW